MRAGVRTGGPVRACVCASSACVRACMRFVLACACACAHASVELATASDDMRFEVITSEDKPSIRSSYSGGLPSRSEFANQGDPTVLVTTNTT